MCVRTSPRSSLELPVGSPTPLWKRLRALMNPMTRIHSLFKSPGPNVSQTPFEVVIGNPRYIPVLLGLKDLSRASPSRVPRARSSGRRMPNPLLHPCWWTCSQAPRPVTFPSPELQLQCRRLTQTLPRPKIAARSLLSHPLL